MNSQQVEEAVIDFIDRCSVFETASAQYHMFIAKNTKAPMLIHLAIHLQASFWKEIAKLSGLSIDELADGARFQIETAHVQFVRMPEGQYMRLYAPDCQTEVL